MIHLLMSHPQGYEGRIKDVVRVMKEQRVVPSDSLVECLIVCAVKCNDWDGAMEHLNTLLARKDADLSADTFNHVLSLALREKSRLPVVKKMYEKRIDNVDYNTLVSMLKVYGILGDVDGINAVISRSESDWNAIVKEYAALHPRLDASSLQSRLEHIFAIARLEAVGECGGVHDPVWVWDQMKDLYEKMPEKRPRDALAMLKGAIRAKRFDQIDVLWADLIGVRKNKDVFGAFIVAYGRAGMKNKAKWLHDEGVEIFGEKFSRLSLLKAYSYCDLDASRSIFEEMASEQRIEKAAYLYMMDAYARVGDLDGKARIAHALKEGNGSK